jgi:hypothetical protein
LREKWSLYHPKNNWPTTVPAKVIDETLDLAGDFAYCVGYMIASIVLTEPMTLDATRSVRSRAEPAKSEILTHSGIHQKRDLHRKQW